MAIKNADKIEFQPTIKDLPLNKPAYTYPSALMFDKDLKAYLNLDVMIRDKPDDEFTLLVKKTGPGRDDYEVDIGTVYDPFYKGGGFGKNYKWSFDRNPLSEYSDFDPDSIARIGRLDPKIFLRTQSPDGA